MRIAFYIPSLHIGGAERTVVRLANKLIEKGNEITIVVSNEQGNLISEIREEIHLVGLNARRIPAIGVLSSVPSLVRYLKNTSVDIFMSFMKHSNIAALLAHRIANIDVPIVVSERNHISRPVEENNHVRNLIILSLMKNLYPHADAITAVSEGVASDLVETVDIHRNEISVIYNPVVNPNLIKKVEKDINHPWFTTNDSRVILGVGSLSPQKDFQTLIRAFTIVSTKRDVRLVILGEGNKREELTQMVTRLGLTDKVDLPGQVANPYPYMRDAAVFVLSSAWEGLPNVLIEAMACGCPVVATDCPSGPREILQNGEYGPLVPVREPDYMAQAICDTLEHPPAETELKERAKRFSDDKITQEYLGLFTKIAK